MLLFLRVTNLESSLPDYDCSLQCVLSVLLIRRCLSSFFQALDISLPFQAGWGRFVSHVNAPNAKCNESSAVV